MRAKLGDEKINFLYIIGCKDLSFKSVDVTEMFCLCVKKFHNHKLSDASRT